MKTKNLYKAAAILAITLTFFLTPLLSKAQATCPYNINNNTSCTIKITYTIFCSSGWYTNTVTIGPGGVYTITCAEFPAGCDRPNIELNLLSVDGFGFICNPPFSQTVAATIPNADANGLFPGAPCNTNSMAWYFDHCDINP